MSDAPSRRVRLLRLYARAVQAWSFGQIHWERYEASEGRDVRSGRIAAGALLPCWRASELVKRIEEVIDHV